MKKRLRKGWLLLIIPMFVFQFMRINEVWGQATYKIGERQRVSVLMGLAQTYQTMGEYEDAIKTYQTILDEYKNSPFRYIQAQNGLASLYQGLGRHEDAIKVYKSIVDEYKKDYPRECIQAQRGIAQSYQNMGRYEEAIKTYQLILDEYKDYPEESISAQLGIADVYRIMGKFDEAIKIYNEMLYKEEAGLQTEAELRAKEEETRLKAKEQ